MTDLSTTLVQETIDTIREKVKAGPPGWEDITKQGLAYHEARASFDTDWVTDILDEVEDELTGGREWPTGGTR